MADALLLPALKRNSVFFSLGELKSSFTREEGKDGHFLADVLLLSAPKWNSIFFSLSNDGFHVLQNGESNFRMEKNESHEIFNLFLLKLFRSAQS